MQEYSRIENLQSRCLISPYNKNEALFIANPTEFQLKISNLISAGSSNIQIISDFDFTLSRSSLDDIKCSTSFGIINSMITCKDILNRVTSYYLYYHPIEINPTLSIDEKMTQMTEWWAKITDAIVSAECEFKNISEIVSKSNLYLRNGIDKVFNICKNHELPFIIVSAGVGDVIEAALKDFWYDNLKLVSNFIETDEECKMIKFSDPHYMSFNKEIALRGETTRSHLIVLGDVPLDINVLNEINYQESLKIGFVNNQDDPDIESYKEKYDVLVYNGNMTILEFLLSSITGQPFDVSNHPSLEILQDHIRNN